MGFLSHRIERSNIEAGDHIYTWRAGFTYSHHGIYVGGDKIVHFTRGWFLSSSVNSSSCLSPTCINFPDCGFRKDGSGVTMSCLDCFLGNGSLYRFEYGVGRLAFIAKFRGGATRAEPDPPEAVVHKAMYLLHKGFGNYDLFSNNCEDFALYCKTGYMVYSKKKKESLGCSGQATFAVGVPVAAILSLPLRLIVSSPAVFVTATAATYSFSRYATDIGVRGDVVKVRVEDIEGLFPSCVVDDDDGGDKTQP